LRAGAVQGDLHAYAGVPELVFETVARDLHFPQPKNSFVIETIVLCFDLAAVFDRLFSAAG
jgi:hypothetical protein